MRNEELELLSEGVKQSDRAVELLLAFILGGLFVAGMFGLAGVL